MSLFISLEGIEGCGKTTQIKILASRLEDLGIRVLVTREPGGCPISDQIRQILLNPGNNLLVAKAELLLYAAARAQHVDEIIAPALQKGAIVLCDRFSDATLAYQGYGRGLDLELIHLLNDVAAGTCRPHLTLLLDMPAEQGITRARARNAASAGPDEDRFEQEALAFHLKVRQGYLELARRAASRFRIIDADGTPEQVADRIWRVTSAMAIAAGRA
jgi:dTMP kinase